MYVRRKYLPDGPDAEAIRVGDFARVDDEAPRFEPVVEFIERVTRVVGIEERRNDRRLPLRGHQRLEAELRHALDEMLVVLAVAAMPGGNSTFRLELAQRLRERAQDVSRRSVPPFPAL